MATPVSIKNLRDTYVWDDRPSRNFLNASRLKIGGSTYRSFIYFGTSIPDFSKVLTAKLRFFNAEAWSGSVTVSAQAVSAGWAGSRINWNNQPAVTGPLYEQTISGAPKNTMWEIDITTLVQDAVDNEPWFGIRLVANGGAVKNIYSSQEKATRLRPVVLIEWAERPEIPENLSPNNNLAVSNAKPVLTYEFVDETGDTDITHHHVQIATDETFSSMVFDSGWVPTSTPKMKLADPIIRTAAISKTVSTPNITFAVGQITAIDQGSGITGTGIPAGTTILSVNSATTATLSANVTSGGAITATLTKNYAGLADGASVWWRVQARDGAGQDTDWSEPEQFSRVSRGVLTSGALGGPNGSGNFYVEDTTPTIIWSLTGRTQAAYQVTITDVDEPDVLLFNTGKITGTNTTVDTGPDRLITDTTKRYLLTIAVWDTIDRIKTDGDPIPYTYQQQFVYQPDSTLDPVTGLVVTGDPPWPWAVLTFQRATPPDAFVIVRDGIVVEDNVDPGDLFLSGTTYVYRDRLAAPRVQHTWQVFAKVNNKNSPPSNSAVFTTRPSFSWLMEPDGSNPVGLVKSASEKAPVVDVNPQSLQEVHQPIGGSAPVLITQFISGFEGKVEAVLADDVISGLSARVMRDRIKAWKRDPGTELLLYMVDEVLQVIPYNWSYRPRAKSGGQILYDVSFDFFQVGY